MKIEEKQKIEIEFWRDSIHESPEADSIHNIVEKAADAGVLLDCLYHYQRIYDFSVGQVLELGAGQGWASCVFKKTFPETHVTVTDISEYAILSLPKWERVFNVEIDNAYACRSYATNEGNASIDTIFCFAAAHHFLAHRRTLAEIYRILKPGGSAFYLYEPVTSKALYSLAYWRVNRKRPEVPEDVLVVSKLQQLAAEVGLALRVDYYPSLLRRRPFEMLYFYVLGRIPFLQRYLPCTANLIFTKLP